MGHIIDDDQKIKNMYKSKKIWKKPCLICLNIGSTSNNPPGGSSDGFASSPS